MVQPGSVPAPARWTVTADLAADAMLDWQPQPTVVCDGAQLRSTVRVALRRGARVILREEAILGRADQRGGRFRGELIIELEGVPLLAHTVLLDGSDPVLAGPAGTGGARVVGMLVVAGEDIEGPQEGAGEQPGLRWACTALDGPGRLLLVLGDSPSAVATLLDHATRCSAHI